MSQKRRATINEITIGYFASAFTPPSLALLLGVTIGQAAPSGSLGINTLLGAFSLLAIMATTIGIGAAPIAIPAIIWARGRQIRSPLIYVGFTGALGAFLLLVSGVADTIERGYSVLTYSLLAGGFVAGLVFWMIAGRKL